MNRPPVKSDFWSKRKARVQAETVAEQELIAEQEHALEMERIEAQSDAEILEGLDLPVPESLKTGDDFSGFMSKAVPERLRRRALRQLWGSNPVLANVDGLVEYGEDYNTGSMVLGNMQTAYQVGKGMLKHVEEMARQAEAEHVAQDLPEVENVNLECTTVPELEQREAETVEADEFAAPLDEAPLQAAPRRRMQFASVPQDSENIGGV